MIDQTESPAEPKSETYRTETYRTETYESWSGQTGTT